MSIKRILEKRIGQVWKCKDGRIYLVSSYEANGKRKLLDLAREQFNVSGWFEYTTFDKAGKSDYDPLYNLITYIGTVCEGEQVKDWNVKIAKEEYTISGGQAENWKLYEVIKDESTDLEGKIVFRIPSRPHTVQLVDLKSKKTRFYNCVDASKLTLKPFFGSITIESNGD